MNQRRESWGPPLAYDSRLVSDAYKPRHRCVTSRAYKPSSMFCVIFV